MLECQSTARFNHSCHAVRRVEHASRRAHTCARSHGGVFPSFDTTRVCCRAIDKNSNMLETDGAILLITMFVFLILTRVCL